MKSDMSQNSNLAVLFIIYLLNGLFESDPRVIINLIFDNYVMISTKFDF